MASSRLPTHGGECLAPAHDLHSMRIHGAEQCCVPCARLPTYMMNVAVGPCDFGLSNEASRAACHSLLTLVPED